LALLKYKLKLPDTNSVKSNNIDDILAVTFFAIAAFFFLTLIIASMGFATFGFASQLLRGFHIAAFYLPFYFAALGWLFYNKKATAESILLANFSFIPFITLALLLKTLLFDADNASLFEIQLLNISRNGVPLVLMALFAIELIIILKLAQSTSFEANNERSELVHVNNINTTKTNNYEELKPIELPPNQDDNQSEEVGSIFYREGSGLKSQLEQINKQFNDIKTVAFPQPEVFTGEENAEQLLTGDKLKLNSDAEFLNELNKAEDDEPPLVDIASINIENDFKKQKAKLEEEGGTNKWLHETDPAIAILSSDDSLPPHLRGNLLSPEETVALNQIATDLDDENEISEDTQIVKIIEGATSSLDEALNSPFKIKSNEEEPLANNHITLEETDEDEPYSNENNQEIYLDNISETEPEVTTTNLEDEPVFDNVRQQQEAINETELPTATNDDDEIATFESVDVKSYSYDVPIKGLLDDYQQNAYWQIDDETKNKAKLLEATLKEFKIEAEVIAIRKGPVITMFELLPSAGVKLSRIEALSDNIAFRLAASRVRIVAPIPGKQAVGIEIPNKSRSLVSFSEIVASPEIHSNKNYIPLALGKDIEGASQIIDLAKTPHLLIAGSTGAGKSVCINDIICSILYTRSPRDVRLILIDPKVVELKPYNDIPHLLTPVITEPKHANQAINWLIYEMERRYHLLDSLGVKNIRSYNKKIKDDNLMVESLPYIVVIIDEFADLMASCGKELEMGIARLAAKSRAAGMHLILATQRPSTDVITGLIKANFPSRIAFMVASKVDSRIILDISGAEQLLGKGDMLFVSSWSPFPVRMQGAFLSEEEVDRVTDYVRSLGEPDYIDDEIFIDDDTDDIDMEAADDPLFDKAIEIVREQKKASASYLQRRLKIGYNRAARLIELMEERGIVGPANGSKGRDLL